MIPTSFPPAEEIARLTARALLEIKAVHFNAETPFTLASGLPSPTYIDCRKLISYPRIRATLMDFLSMGREVPGHKPWPRFQLDLPGWRAFEDRLAWMRGARSDYEIALPLHELEAFAGGTGYYAGLSRELRLEQLDRLIQLTEQLYPSLRLYLFDARRVFSAPVTIFGPLLAVVYLNGLHIPFQSNSACAVPDRIGNRLQRASYINETCHGLILDALTDSGRYDNALILCAGDHGEDSRITGTDGENHLARLTQLTDSVIHPMFLVKPPANLPVAERRTLERNAAGLVSLLDIAPTVASALDLDPPAGMAFDGQSLFQPIPADRIHITMNTNEWRSWPRSAVMIAQDQARICIDYQDTSHLCTDANGHPFAAQDDRKDRLLAEALKFPALSKTWSTKPRNWLRSVRARSRCWGRT